MTVPQSQCVSQCVCLFSSQDVKPPVSERSQTSNTSQSPAGRVTTLHLPLCPLRPLVTSNNPRPSPLTGAFHYRSALWTTQFSHEREFFSGIK